jgi:hypothetical protein
MVSDIVLLKEPPAIVRNSMAAYVGCVAGAMMRGDYLDAVRDTGFEEISVVDELPFPIDYMANDPALRVIIADSSVPSESLAEFAGSVVSIEIRAVKPVRQAGESGR